jgi:hypothetical protein
LIYDFDFYRLLLRESEREPKDYFSVGKKF